MLPRSSTHRNSRRGNSQQEQRQGDGGRSTSLDATKYHLMESVSGANITDFESHVVALPIRAIPCRGRARRLSLINLRRLFFIYAV